MVRRAASRVRFPTERPMASVSANEGSTGPADAAVERPAFYALRPGGWRDYWTLLHPPYTAWHLSYVAIGAAVAPQISGARLVATLLGFFLGVGVAAHA